MEIKRIVNIELEKIHPHPGNPRKNLGDLKELAESIKKNGIMQNLTVIPMNGKEGEYISIIGHRRCAAAKIAELTEVPCRIVDGLTEKEQLSIMLEENMQRNDLSIWEQVQGFQLMLDLGETEDTISEKTGFSKTTIKHRLNIAKLDQKTLQEKESQEGFQLSLIDLYELEKIKDIKIRNKILKDSVTSRDLARRALIEQNEQKRKENLKLYIAILKKLGVKKAPVEAENEFYSNKWERLQEFNLSEKPSEEIKFNNNEKQMFYLERYGRLYVICKMKKEKRILTAEEEFKRQQERNKKQIKAILNEATNIRRIFIEGIICGKIKKIKDTNEIEAELFEQMLGWDKFIGNNQLRKFFLGCEVYDATKEEVEVADEKCKSLSVIYKLLCLVSSMVGEANLVNWDYTYNTVSGEKVNKFYEILKKYGFEFINEEEKKVIEGSSDLYTKKSNEW